MNYVLFALLAGAACARGADASAEQRQVSAWARQALLGEALPSSAESGPSTGRLPFSFTYGGESSSRFLASWPRSDVRSNRDGDRETYAVTRTDQRTGLQVDLEASLLSDFPAVEWVLRFTNTGAADTPIIQDLRALDLEIAVPAGGEVVLHHSQGSRALASDFLPLSERIAEDPWPRQMAPDSVSSVRLASSGGRSSDGALPFFNLQLPGGGIVGAIGWSGGWEMLVRRANPKLLTIAAGQPDVHLTLHPGESIRTPRILLLMWQGTDQMRGHNLFRRMIAAHYQPRRDGKLAVTPVSWTGYFAFDEGNAVTEENQLAWIERIRKAGAECYWLDAGWFEGGWPHGVGNLFPDPARFPHGLAPLGEAAHRANMKFILWFEPERIDPASRIAKEHPGWVLHANPVKSAFHPIGVRDGLFNLGDPAAREWLTGQLLKSITAGGVDVFRIDFNIQPLAFWRQADSPDRRGMTEIRYIEGLYRMLDELVRRRPGLTIDDCASGGRRIDLEMLSRCYVLWRSDRNGREALAQQVQVGGLSLYLPQHASGVYAVDPYSVRSAAITGMTLCADITGGGFPLGMARQAIREVKELRPYHYGDYYPVFGVATSEEIWAGWQFDRPESGDGMVMVLRRRESPYSRATLNLRAIDPSGSYEIEMRDGYEAGAKREIPGGELMRIPVEIGSNPGSLLIKYRKLTAVRPRAGPGP